ncbi:MAG TPA: lipid-A-disaccharide synthase [Alphaproteobacteria bacterium]|nr:lipid-A-disaccharide synthase [Alphaproteobacteria bacterium]
MSDPLRLFVLAGEASGDRIGADLVDRLRATGAVDLGGVGGPDLAAAGLTSLFPMSDLSVMGFEDVLKRLPLLLWRVRQTARAIVSDRPDVAVLIDSQVFAQAVARRVRRAAPAQRLVLYVAPTVWAWKPERAAALRPLFDEVLAVLPFEPEVMKTLGGPATSYVGHPALGRFPMRPVQPERGPLLLLPGSRPGELRRHLPVIRAVAEQLAGHPAVSGLRLPTLTNLAERLRAEVATWSAPVEVVTGDDRLGAFARAVAAVAVSGTVTLELALAGVPLVAIYLGDRRQAREYERLGRPAFALPNIVANGPVVAELPLATSDPAPVIAAMRALLDSPDACAEQAAAFRSIRLLMERGTSAAPRTDPAERVRAIAAQRLSMGT